MASLIEVRKKIQSVQNTRKITQAMQCVAASRMKGFQRKALSTRAYAMGLLGLLGQNGQALSESSYGTVPHSDAVLFVLVTSDKGLCGALNARLVRELFLSKEWLDLQPEQRLLITIGKKSREAARKANVKVEASFDGVKEELDAMTALHIVNKILDYWDRGACRAIRLAAPEYVNPFVFHTRVKTYLPLTPDMLSSHGLPEPDRLAERGILHEPSTERVAESLSLHIVQSLFIHAFFELKASEYSSRMVAMKSATDAAGELGRTLTIEYNKERQARITQELAEISGAVAAMA